MSGPLCSENKLKAQEKVHQEKKKGPGLRGRGVKGKVCMNAKACKTLICLPKRQPHKKVFLQIEVVVSRQILNVCKSKETW